MPAELAELAESGSCLEMLVSLLTNSVGQEASGLDWSEEKAQTSIEILLKRFFVR